MAERRMFSKAVINSARFLTMPPSSRLLYYDLGMAADDDGIVEAFTVIRTTSAAEDDLRVLIAKGFVSLLNDELVTYITDWNKNNQIRKDRYCPSIYQNLLVKLGNGNQRLTQYSVVEDRSVEGSVDMADKPPRAARFTPPTVDEVRDYCQERGNSVDPERFVDFYASKGWLVGKTKMKDWRAAVRSWERSDSQQKAQDKNRIRSYDADESFV